MKNRLLLPFTAVILFSIIACEKDKIDTSFRYYTDEEYAILTASLNLPDQLYDYVGVEKPFRPENSFFDINNGVQENHKATLGRVLFYDVNLSADNSVSCASCHQQHLAFADNVRFSEGIMQRSTARNSLALGVFQSFSNYSNNPQTTLFWDGRASNIHEQMIQTIANPNEMGMSMQQVREKIEDIDYYDVLFEKAFGVSNINESNILLALESFMNSISATSTKFDEATENTFAAIGNLPGLTAKENQGKSLFQANCQGCHNEGLEILLVNFESKISSANNGLELNYADKGEGEVNPAASAIGVFKVPSLRNIELTAPYMHDGRFASLEEVIDFYSEGIQDHPNLHEKLKDNSGSPKKFNFTAEQKDALIQFFKTLTDHTMQSQPKWSNPFL